MKNTIYKYDLLNSSRLYTPSPHILKNTQHFFKNGVKSIFSFKFLFDILFNRHDVIVLSWGTKTNSFIIKLLSLFSRICYLEDGFYRSFNTGRQGDISLSLSIDFTMPFYYSNVENDLIQLFKHKEDILSQDVLDFSSKCLEFIVENKLSKYNNNLTPDSSIEYNKNNVLIIDQTLGDQSLVQGGVPPSVDIKYIVETILISNPDANIFLKAHPETISGDKESALKVSEYFDFLNENNVIVLSENYNPIQLMERMEQIHVLTSQVGLEALFLNKEVHCYGKPFYSKVGLTINHFNTPFVNKLTTHELFSICCDLYCVYFDNNGNNIDFFTFLKNLDKNKRSLLAK